MKEGRGVSKSRKTRSQRERMKQKRMRRMGKGSGEKKRLKVAEQRKEAYCTSNPFVLTNTAYARIYVLLPLPAREFLKVSLGQLGYLNFYRYR